MSFVGYHFFRIITSNIVLKIKLISRIRTESQQITYLIKIKNLSIMETGGEIDSLHRSEKVLFVEDHHDPE